MTPQTHDSDPLAACQGIGLGAVLGLTFWAGIGLILTYLCR